MTSLTDAVATSVAALSPEINDAVKDVLVNRVKQKRVTQLVDAIDKLDKLEKEFRKFKPDVVAYADDGTVVSTNWSKAKLDERNKAKQAIEKATAAIEAAIAGDFSRLGEAKPEPASE